MMWLTLLPLLTLFVQVHSARGYVVMQVSAEHIEDPSILFCQRYKSEQLATGNPFHLARRSPLYCLLQECPILRRVLP